jgi:hypothetical protein
MLKYTEAWETQDLNKILDLYHYPVASLRSGELLVNTIESMRETVSRILPWWKRDGAKSNSFDPLPPLNDTPSTVILRVCWGEWSLNVPGCARLPSPTFFYITSQLKGEWKVASIISEWPKAPQP